METLVFCYIVSTWSNACGNHKFFFSTVLIWEDSNESHMVLAILKQCCKNHMITIDIIPCGNSIAEDNLFFIRGHLTYWRGSHFFQEQTYFE